MLRKEITIKGIDINEKTFLLSQYTDDTQIYLNGSKTSLIATLYNFIGNKISSIFKIYSFIYCSFKPSGTVGQTIRETVL